MRKKREFVDRDSLFVVRNPSFVIRNLIAINGI
jgi:hypothetical protein